MCPNWCQNDLYITGPEEEIEKFLDAIRVRDDEATDGERFQLLSALYPTPSELVNEYSPFGTEEERQARIEKYGFEDWYDWRISHWGTKWPEASLELDHEPEYITAIFDTAWAPPLKALEKISKDFPALNFEISFEEWGIGFAGTYEFENGKIIMQEDHKLQFDEEGLPIFEDE
jgi:hypothetical protein